MNPIEKEISYTTANSYSTLNALQENTEYVWFACHGMGYLSRYFLKYFKALDPNRHYIIAPQAQSKYYIQPEYKHVGASWLTKENTLKETENVMRYFDAIFANEAIPKQLKLIVLGYSQGVSVAMRYLAKKQLDCYKLVMMSGGIPKELSPSDLRAFTGKAYLTYGIKDEFLNAERIIQERQLALELFGSRLEIHPFDGNHKVNTNLINSIV